MIDLAELARSETERQMRACAAIARDAEPLAGGMLLASEPGSWCNFVTGVWGDATTLCVTG